MRKKAEMVDRVVRTLSGQRRVIRVDANEPKPAPWSQYYINVKRRRRARNAMARKSRRANR